MSMVKIAVTGLNATDNPGPGVPVIRALRAALGNGCEIIGLAYETLDPGSYMDGIADRVYLMPFPSEGAEVFYNRIAEIHKKSPIDVIIPTLDSELSAYLKIQNRLHQEMGIRMFLPKEDQLKLRSKAKFHELSKLGIRVPKSIPITQSEDIRTLHEQFEFPIMVKGQFYDAYIAYSPMEVESHFQKLRAKWGIPVIIQEYIFGEEYDVVALGDGKGGIVGAVPMKKMQLTDKGKAWGGITIRDTKIHEFVTGVIKALKWRGACELEVMRVHSTGELILLEINPRFPAWVYLSVGAGKNLPYALLCLANGEKVDPMSPPEPGIMFLRYSYDQICSMKDYESLTVSGELHRTGESK